jgi:hypothetical protein
MVKPKVESMEIQDIRYKNFRLLVDAEERERGRGALERVAAKIGKLNNQVSNFGGELSPGETRRPKAIGNRIARDIEKAYGFPAGWMDSPQWNASTSAAAPGTSSGAALDQARLVRAFVQIDELLRSTGRDVTTEEKGKLVADMYDYLTIKGL